ncbi:transcriptional regulator YeiL [Priestia endophytica]|uniref:cAMP-binding domain of CRP or a regulatory subunit of cAMP-dependent protein kinases n=1 Tax=Priestia endophytica DSM 13796 TaxID=1121089 RepID=A0A1I6BVE2_9BACI|nr:transcriptional regulator YeiL [Priestia endophytica]KYG30391.1 XRE family transcriptional regulator [Priestia endophytica]SFQ84912.1 cAMP-binding domain of CRP or a regulatory subunit of cAMP-dependent protein kinases [Priestia endophytica DSM 13796]
MKFLTDLMQDYYIKKYPIESLFTFPIKPYIQVCQFERGEFIYKEGSYPQYLYYLVEGKAKLYVTHENGKVSLINFFQSPTFMGEIELLNSERSSKAIQTVTKTICLAIPIHTCKEKLLRDVTFLRYLCSFLSEKATRISAKYTQNQAYPLENRLASFILLSADGNFYKEKHTEVCEYLGVSYRHLLHVLAQLCKTNIIEKQSKGYIIRDKELLEKLAKIKIPN